MFKALAKFIAPSGMPSPVLWGDETTVRERLGKGLSELNLTRCHYTFSYPFPPSEVVDFFRLYYGPTHRAFESLDVGGRGDSLTAGGAMLYGRALTRTTAPTGRAVAPTSK